MERGVWAILEAFSCLEISRERKVQVPESFENFCCAKTGRELSLKRKPS